MPCRSIAEKTPDEVLEFCRAWTEQVRLVLVPTAYPQLSFAEITALGKATARE